MSCFISRFKYLLLKDKVVAGISGTWLICWLLSGVLNLKFDGIICFFYMYISPLVVLILVIRILIILMRKNDPDISKD